MRYQILCIYNIVKCGFSTVHVSTSVDVVVAYRLKNCLLTLKTVHAGTEKHCRARLEYSVSSVKVR